MQLTALMNADKAVAQDMKENLIVQTTAQIKTLEKARDELGRQQALHNAWANSINFVKTSLLGLVKEGLEIFVPEITYAAEAIVSFVSKIAAAMPTIGAHVTLTGKFKEIR